MEGIDGESLTNTHRVPLGRSTQSRQEFSLCDRTAGVLPCSGRPLFQLRKGSRDRPERIGPNALHWSWQRWGQLFEVDAMMDQQRTRRNRGVVSRATPAELAAQSQGYSANGESQFTRNISHSHSRFISGGPPRLKGAGERTLSQKIEYERGRLRHAEAELRITDDPERRAKLEASIDIKAGLIARWTAEQNGEVS
jgi:hypothetical protein